MCQSVGESEYLYGTNYDSIMTDKSTLNVRCPYCKRTVIPELLASLGNNPRFVFLFPCCGNTYFLTRKERNSWLHGVDKVKPKKTIRPRVFSDIINEISPKFEKIYNEAVKAQQSNLMEICGGGYRKALEFLTYDYAIKKNPESESVIKGMGQLSNVISTYLPDDFTKLNVASATWLGNEEVHYVKKYEDLDIDDLIEFIDDVVTQIELNEKLEEKKKMMPKLEEKVLEMNKKTKNQP